MPKKKIDEKLNHDFVKQDVKPVAEDTELIWCAVCGERIGQRKGTFTGWIFRTVTCACPSPSPTSNLAGNETANLSIKAEAAPALVSEVSGSKDSQKIAKGTERSIDLTRLRAVGWLIIALAACYATWFVTMMIERHRP